MAPVWSRVTNSSAAVSRTSSKVRASLNSELSWKVGENLLNPDSRRAFRVVELQPGDSQAQDKRIDVDFFDAQLRIKVLLHRSCQASFEEVGGEEETQQGIDHDCSDD